MEKIQLGDFTNLAKQYVNRPAYDTVLLGEILKLMGKDLKDITLADVGAGTGKLTKVLAEMGINKIYAVEPNAAMREEGIVYTKEFPFIKWMTGSGEETGLETDSVNWLTMASSFHWTDPAKSLPEFYRVLNSHGFITILWNTRNVSASPLHTEIENCIKKIVPELKRVSSGSQAYTKNWEEVLVSTGHFTNVRFIETDYSETMTKERYMNVWRSVNDIQAQAGPERFEQILLMIEQIIAPLEDVVVPYKMRSWTAQRIN
ncbi:MAG: methyltransferase domain-containing protein [Spirochaetaceae bacterium]|jgi:ubiquinone/menaquinone biosynthesis C-methylase UbiE|nr:methyltransferase domain-containing protein [Spirochaetaceae bacterium]